MTTLMDAALRDAADARAAADSLAVGISERDDTIRRLTERATAAERLVQTFEEREDWWREVVYNLSAGVRGLGR